jgi:hypothetical protein
LVLGAEDFRLCVGRRELPTLGQHASGSWGFYLRRKNGWTRLLVRGSGGAVGHAAFGIGAHGRDQLNGSRVVVTAVNPPQVR